MKKLMTAILSASVALSMSVCAFAGQWAGSDSSGWLWVNDDGTSPVDQWLWIDDDGDGIEECYYFDGYGLLITDGTTPDGSEVNGDGAWVVNGEVQHQAASGSADTASIPSGPFVAGLQTQSKSWNGSDGKTALTVTYQEVILNDNATDALKNAIAAWNQRNASLMDQWAADNIEGANSSRPSTLDETATIGIDNGVFLSISLGDAYYTGGAHPYYGYDNITFNAITGETCTLENLTPDFQAFGRKVLPYIEAQLQSTYGSSLFSDANSTIESMWNDGSISWYISEAGLTLCFPDYAIGPHSLGTIEVTYPMSMLADDIGM